jgi:DNA sulfur modification protein DndE
MGDLITKINISKKATALLTQLHAQLGLRPNILARNALVLSMQNGDHFRSNIEVDTSGKEFNSYTLFGSNEKIYEMILQQYYSGKLDNREWGKVISFHIEKGLIREDFNTILNS